MAKLNMSLAMAVLFLGSIAVTILPGLVASVAPAPASDITEYLKECASKLGDCGIQTYRTVFLNAPAVTKECCTVLLSVGKPCHDSLISSAIHNATLFHGDPSQALSKSQSVWDGCVNLTTTPPPTRQ